MGQALLRLAAEHPETLRIVAAVTGRAPAQRVVDGVPFFAASELPGAPVFDVAIDFSLPEGFDPAAGAVRGSRGRAGVGYHRYLQHTAPGADAAAAKIPLVWASNFSLGVAVLDELVERAAQALAGWDCDIVESHHTQKKRRAIGHCIDPGRGRAAGGAEPHYASLRAGDIVGEHLVQFTGLGERIELVHRATNRDIFARGALFAARQLQGGPRAATACGPAAVRRVDSGSIPFQRRGP